MIKIEGLRKSFGEVKAVDDLSFEVREGELFAFLGVNHHQYYLRAAGKGQRQCFCRRLRS